MLLGTATDTASNLIHIDPLQLLASLACMGKIPSRPWKLTGPNRELKLWKLWVCPQLLRTVGKLH